MTLPFLAQIETAIDSADKLAGKDDRVLFLVTLILFFIAGGVAVKWFMSQLDKRDQKIEMLSKEVGQVRETFNQYLMTSVKELYSIVSHNTDVIAQNTKTIADSSEISERKIGILNRIEDDLKEGRATAIRQ